MRTRSLLGALLLVCLIVPITSCSNDPSLTSIVITPSTETVILAACGDQQAQPNFTAMGYYTHPGHPPITKDITDDVSWYSYDASLVTVNSDGVVSIPTCATPGAPTASIIITASANGYNGLIVGTATFDEQEPPETSTSGSADVTSLTIEQPGRILPDAAAQLTAVGRTREGAVVPLAAGPRWTSSDSLVATIDPATGRARSIGAGRSTITAVYTNPDGSTAVGVSHLNVSGAN
jgi:hypothetical protein